MIADTFVHPIQKMKVTMEGEKIIGLLHEVIAAKV
jgi:hypothetical protein